MPLQKKATNLREIASVLGVSHATVSRALRNAPNVNEVTRARILAYTTKIGYRSNPLVASLLQQVRSGKTYRTDTVIAWINLDDDKQAWRNRPYYKNYLKSARAQAEQLGYKINEFWAADPQLAPERLEQILLSRGIQGLIVPCEIDRFVTWKLDWSQFSMVALETEGICEANYTHVGSAHYENFRIAWQALREMGYQKIGLLLSRYHESGMGHKWIARYAYEQAKLPQQQRVPCLQLDQDPIQSVPTITKWLKRSKPDCLLCCDLAVKGILENLGYRVPEDIGIAHLHISQDVAGWSGINRRDAAIAEAAVKALASQCSRNEYGPRDAPQFFRLRGQWVTGTTTRSR